MAPTAHEAIAGIERLVDDVIALVEGPGSQEVTGLTAFAGKTGLQNEFTAGPDTDERSKFTMTWTDPIETQITDPLEATLGLD